MLYTLYLIPSEEDKIMQLQSSLNNTANAMIEYLEGLITQAEYDTILEQRKAWKEELNILQQQNNIG